jgi:3-oxoacyl-[acyl-carrier protein] reductase
MSQWKDGFLAKEFTGRRILVTGSSRGIGAAVAAAFAALGARVAIHGSTLSPALQASARAVGEAGPAPVTLIGDFRRSSAVESVVGEAVKALGGLDCLINNAGTMLGRHPADQITDAVVSEVLDLNVKSVITACRVGMPALKASGSGCIINTSSISGRTGGSPGASVYSGAKAFVGNLTRSLATEFADVGVRVNAVSPGTIDTDFHQRYSSPEKLAATAARIPLKRLGTAEDCVGAYLFLASSQLAGYITGQIVEVNGGQAMP